MLKLKKGVFFGPQEHFNSPFYECDEFDKMLKKICELRGAVSKKYAKSS